jgi:hypothetical protein
MAPIPKPARRPRRFGGFELNLHSGELRKAGALVGVQDQSLNVLVELVGAAGDLVTRPRPSGPTVGVSERRVITPVDWTGHGTVD